MMNSDITRSAATTQARQTADQGGQDTKTSAKYGGRKIEVILSSALSGIGKFSVNVAVKIFKSIGNAFQASSKPIKHNCKIFDSKPQANTATIPKDKSTSAPETQKVNVPRPPETSEPPVAPQLPETPQSQATPKPPVAPQQQSVPQPQVVPQPQAAPTLQHVPTPQAASSKPQEPPKPQASPQTMENAGTRAVSRRNAGAAKASKEAPAANRVSEEQPEAPTAKPAVLTPTVNKIKDLVPRILQRDDSLGIQYLKQAKVFAFEGGDVVYKMAVRSGGINDEFELMEQRYRNIQRAQEVCKAHELGLLVIPKVQMYRFTVEGQEVILIEEQRMNINDNESVQEEMYHNYSTELNETARQLAVFVAHTGFNDVTPRNIPIMNEAEGFQGPRRVALIDLEHMQNTAAGFTGSSFNASRGLLHSVATEQQVDTVIDEAKKVGINITPEQRARRLRDIESDKRLREFYTAKGITTGKEPIEVDVESLGLDLDEEATFIARYDWATQQNVYEVVKMRDVVNSVVDEINKLLQENSPEGSLKARRAIQLNVNEGPLAKYRDLGLDSKKARFSEEELKGQWIARITNALVEQGYIFKPTKVGDYRLQA